MPSLRRDTDAIMAEITVAAAACFWETLWDIAATAPARAAFRTLGPNHPFLYRDEQRTLGKAVAAPCGSGCLGGKVGRGEGKRGRDGRGGSTWAAGMGVGGIYIV